MPESKLGDLCVFAREKQKYSLAKAPRRKEQDADSQVIPFRLTERLRRKRQEAEARYLYRITGGFMDPDPPSCEARRMLEEGWELP